MYDVYMYCVVYVNVVRSIVIVGILIRFVASQRIRTAAQLTPEIGAFSLSP